MYTQQHLNDLDVIKTLEEFKRRAIDHLDAARLTAIWSGDRITVIGVTTASGELASVDAPQYRSLNGALGLPTTITAIQLLLGERVEMEDDSVFTIPARTRAWDAASALMWEESAFEHPGNADELRIIIRGILSTAGMPSEAIEVASALWTDVPSFEITAAFPEGSYLPVPWIDLRSRPAMGIAAEHLRWLAIELWFAAGIDLEDPQPQVISL